MGIRIKGKEPVEFRLSGRSLSGMANGGRVVWRKPAVEDERPVDFLRRSDNGKTYSSLHGCLVDIKADYPGGLTLDLTVRCVKEAKETRDPRDPDKTVGERLFLASLEDWNQGSSFALTIDGDGIYTIDGHSLGGIRLEGVDNVIIKNTRFANFANHMEQSSPEEMSAVMFVGSKDRNSRNLYVHNCVFDGLNGSTGSYFTIVTKLTDNVCVDKSVFSNGSGLTFKMTDTRLITITRNSISGKERIGVTGHPGIFSNSGTVALYVEDNDVDGRTFTENLFYINNVSYAYMRRNTFHDCPGRPVGLVSNNPVKKFVFECNLIHDVLNAPIYPWIMDVVSIEGDILDAEFGNNTVYFNGGLYRQWFTRGTEYHCDRLVSFNNIFIEATSGNVVSAVYQFKGVREYVSGSNVYKAKLRDGSGTRLENMQIMNSSNEDGEAGYLTITGNDARDLSHYTGLGLEAGSKALGKAVKLLPVESGGDSYGLIASIANGYPADKAHLPAFDMLYRKNANLTTIGAINANGVSWDEASDTTAGYEGINDDRGESFDESVEYTVPADDTLLVSSKSNNRDRLVRISLDGSQDTYISLGHNAIFNPVCLLGEDGTYKDNQSYDIKITSI